MKPLFLFLFALIALAACGDDDDSCLEGATEPCVCPSGVDGTRTCEAEAFGGCVCMVDPDGGLPDGGDPADGGAPMDASLPADGGAVAVGASWTFPAVVEGRLPGYLSHLMGAEVDHEYPLRSVCVTATNDGVAVDLRVDAELGDDGAGSETAFALAEGETEDVCAEPTYDRDVIDALESPLETTLAGSLTSAAGVPLAAETESVTLSPGTLAWWTHPTFDREQLLELFAVFVRPEDPAIDALVDEAAEASRSPDDFRSGYTRSPRVRTWTLSPGDDGRDVPPILMLDGESLGWSLDSIVGGGVVDVLLFTGADFITWAEGGSATPTQSWTAQAAGDTGTFVNTVAGASYVLVVVSPDDASGDRMVTLSRNWTELEIVDDALSSLWFALFRHFGLPQAESLPAGYFTADRALRSPAELLEPADTIDAVEAAVLLAAALEAMQLHATLTVTDDLMMAGVLSSPGSEILLPLDLTDGRFGSYPDARTGSLATRTAAMGDAGFAEVVLPELRTRGIAPAP